MKNSQPIKMEKISNFHQKLGTFLPFIGLFCFLVLLLCHSWTGPDIWYHMSWGRSIFQSLNLLPSTQPLISQPIVVNTYWLFQAVNYLIFKIGGIYLVSALYVLFWTSITIFWFKV